MSLDRLTVIRNYFSEQGDAKNCTPGTHAVQLDCELERNGMAVVPMNVAIIFACILSRGEIDAVSLNSMLITYGLAEIVKYDPNVNTGGGEDSLPGDPYLKYSPALMSLLSLVRPHLVGNTH